MMKYSLTENVLLEFLTPDSESHKFGYYYYSPLSSDNSKLLSHKLKFEGRPVKKEDEVEVGYFDISNGQWNLISRTKAFNWQIGSMLQWRGPDFNTEVLFNDANEEGYISKLHNIKSRDFKVLPKSIHVCDEKGEYSYTLNYERANFTRAYNYESFVDGKWDIPLPSEDGVLKLDLKTGSFDLIVSVKQIIDFLKIDIEPGVYYWLEHITLNPESTLFSVYLRYGDSIGYTTRCVFVDINGKIVGEHVQSDLEFISHLGWINEKEYVIFTRKLSNFQNELKSVGLQPKKSKTFKQKIGGALVKFYRKGLKPVVPKGFVRSIVVQNKNNNYQRANVDGNRVDRIIVEPSNLDGHPTFTKDGKFMLTDTYSDDEGFRHLLVYNLETQKTHSLGRFFSTYDNCNWRTDLHPRFSIDESRVIIDTNHNGNNQMMVLKLNWRFINVK